MKKLMYGQEAGKNNFYNFIVGIFLILVQMRWAASSALDKYHEM